MNYTQAELDAMVFDTDEGEADFAVRARERANYLSSQQVETSDPAPAIPNGPGEYDHARLAAIRDIIDNAARQQVAGYKEQVSNTASLLNERGSTHGSFSDNARISQQVKEYFRLQANYNNLTDIQREALDNIAIKVSRILSLGGKANNHADNWDDIAGYATLASNELAGNAQ